MFVVLINILVYVIKFGWYYYFFASAQILHDGRVIIFSIFLLKQMICESLVVLIFYFCKEFPMVCTSNETVLVADVYEMRKLRIFRFFVSFQTSCYY
jgi:hypothetical protein